MNPISKSAAIDASDEIIELAASLLELKASESISSFAVDSREIRVGGLFFSLPGAKVDGHRFLAEVREKGAVAAVVNESYRGESYGLELYRTADPLLLLQACARLRFEQVPARVVAITGSMGKTTTKEFAKTLLSERLKVFATPGNRNTQIGLPLSILELKGDEEVLILEMGMTAPGHIRNLVTLFPPDIGLVTAVALAHAGGFASLEEIGRTKAEVFCSSRTKEKLIAHVALPLMPAEVRESALTFSIEDPSATYFARCGTDRIEIFERGILVASTEWRLLGRQHQHNFLAACAVGRSLGLSWSEVLEGSSCLELVPGRFFERSLGGIRFIDDSYNANVDSMRAALDNLPEPVTGGRRIAVLGEMVELGAFSKECHEKVAHHALKRVDLLLCLGEKARMMVEWWRTRGRVASWYPCLEDLLHGMRRIVRNGDVVLLKGSRTMQLERIMEFWET